MFGNRAVYQDGWYATNNPQASLGGQNLIHPLQEDKWELYNTNEDFSLANDLGSTKS